MKPPAGRTIPKISFSCWAASRRGAALSCCAPVSVNRALAQFFVLIDEDGAGPVAAVVDDGRATSNRITHASSHFAAAAHNQQQA